MEPTIKIERKNKKGSKNHLFNRNHVFWKIILKSVYCSNLEALILLLIIVQICHFCIFRVCLKNCLNVPMKYYILHQFNFLLLAVFCLANSCYQNQPSRGVLKKRYSENMQQIYRRTAMPKCDFNKQLCWNHTSTWVFSCKFAAYFQNNFFLTMKSFTNKVLNIVNWHEILHEIWHRIKTRFSGTQSIM